jgi:hypothetical protein
MVDRGKQLPLNFPESDSPKQLSVLVPTYACPPNLGSEPGGDEKLGDGQLVFHFAEQHLLSEFEVPTRS